MIIGELTNQWEDGFSSRIGRTLGSIRNAIPFGLMMGDGFANQFEAPLPLKAFIESESRAENGKHIIADTPRFDSRELALTFRIISSSESDLKIQKERFYSMLYNSPFRIKVNGVAHKLYYTGKNTSFDSSLRGYMCSITARFIEPDPTDNDDTTTSVNPDKPFPDKPFDPLPSV